MATTKVITGKVRFCYVNVFEPTAMEGSDKKRYNVCILIDKGDTATLAKIKAGIDEAIALGMDKIGKNGKVMPGIKMPLRDGDEDRADDPAFENCYFLNASSMNKPEIVDAKLEPIMAKDEFYSGAYGRASINFYAFNTNGNRGIATGLNNIQKLAEGERLAGGSSAADDFSEDDDLM